MVLKNVFLAITCTLLLGWSGVSIADEYRPDQFLGLDLSKAVLSPKPLGPPAEFWPFPVEARGDPAGEGPQASAEPAAEPKIVLHKTRVIHKTRVADLRAEAPRGAARTKLVRRHGNPLDAQASDPRIQVWPCKSGAICGWKR
jgi:hypothetical protein